MLYMKAHRNSNLELYRIIVMLFIVAHHYVVNSGLFQLMSESPLTVNSAFLYLFGMWGKTGINCFVLITGYFMCKSTTTINKFFKLLFEVIFYKIVIYLIFVLLESLLSVLQDLAVHLFLYPMLGMVLLQLSSFSIYSFHSSIY